jgi:transcriptional regulator with XRE-family HTH domain
LALWGSTGVPVGRLLAERRHARRLSQGDVAGRLGKSVANISRIEHGADLRVSTLLDVARELRLEPMLVPKEHVPAVRALLSSLEHEKDAPHDDDRPRFT